MTKETKDQEQEQAPHPRAPGIYEGIPNAEYHEDKTSFSSSFLKQMDVPARGYYSLHNPSPYKDCFRLGGAIHKYILELETFNQEFLTGISCARRSNANKEEWALWFTENGGDGFEIVTHPAAEWNGLFERQSGKNMVTPEEITAIKEMARSVAHNKKAMQLLEGGRAESSVYWKDEETELTLRCRPDYLNRFCSDLKSCVCAEERIVQMDMHRRGYHISQAMYQEGLLRVTGDYHPFLFIFIEKVPPYLCAVYRLSDTSEKLGHSIFRKHILTLAECLYRNHWPGIPDNMALPLPTYAFDVDVDIYASDDR